MSLKVKWAINESITLRASLRVLDINPDHWHIRAGRCFHNIRKKYNTLKERRARKSCYHLGRSNRQKSVRVPVVWNLIVLEVVIARLGIIAELE